ncbi:MAG TPA: hypothetical protein VMN56_12300 [Casimicrobiaceae bacterium]|nr:hypothetical protein [Casimicrobiaceae bacterium]
MSLAYDRWLDPLQTDPGTFAPGTSASYGSLPNGSYTFHVLAKDGAGNLSAPATATFTVAVPPGPPGAPAPASATLIAPHTVRVAWANVAGETRYVVQRCAATRGCYCSTIAPNAAADTTQLDDVVDSGYGAGNFGYQVQACNGAGCSGWAATPFVNVP